MKVTKVQITLAGPRHDGKPSNLVAHAKVWLDEELVISQIKLFNDDGDFNIEFPKRSLSRDLTGGENVKIPLVNPTTKPLRKHITEEIVKAYIELSQRQNVLKTTDDGKATNAI